MGNNRDSRSVRIKYGKSPYSDGLIFHRLDDGCSLGNHSFVNFADAFRKTDIDGKAGRQRFGVRCIGIDSDLLLGLSCRGQDHHSSMLHGYIEAQYTLIEGTACWHIQRTNVWYGTNDVHRSSLRGRFSAVVSEASLNGRVGLSGSAGSLPHDSFEIFFGRHWHASRPRDKDPQRLHPKAGCLIPATDEDMLPFAPINAIRLGRIEEGQARGLAYEYRSPIARTVNRAILRGRGHANWYRAVGLCLLIRLPRNLDWREQSLWSDRRRCADRGLSCERPKDAKFRATSGREPVMKEKLRFLGLDVHAETIAVAVAEPEGKVRSLGTIPNRAEYIRKLIKKLGPADKLRACYEAGPTGYVVYWQLAELGVECEVVAPTLVPVKAGDRVKTDRRDAEKLARCYRSGDLTAVWVPDEGSEALRDLVRAREAAKQDQTRARHRLSKFLLRSGQRPPTGVRSWTRPYLIWVAQLRFTQIAQESTRQDYLHEVEHMRERVARLEQAIIEAVKLASPALQKVINDLQALRGIADISAVTIAASWARYLASIVLAS